MGRTRQQIAVGTLFELRRAAAASAAAVPGGQLDYRKGAVAAAACTEGADPYAMAALSVANVAATAQADDSAGGMVRVAVGGGKDATVLA